MLKSIKTSHVRVFFIASVVWHIFFFIFTPRMIELPGLLESWWTYNGLVYYRDFATFHFPIGRWVLLPFYLVTNWNLHVGPVLGLVTHLICITLIYKFGLKRLSERGIIMAISFYTLFSWYLGTAIMFYHEMLVGLLLLFAFIYFDKMLQKEKVSNKSVFLLGIILSLCELSGQIVTPTIFVFSLLFCFFYYKKIMWYLLGLFLPLLVIGLYFLSENGFQDFFQQNFIYYTTYADTYQKIPFLSLPLYELTVFYLPVVFAVVYFFKSGVRKLDRSLFLLLVICISTIPFILFSVFHFHHVSFALPVLSLLVGFLFSSKFSKSSLLAGLLIFLMSFRLAPWYFKSVKLNRVGRIVNNVSVGDSMFQTVEWVKKNTLPDEKMLVAGDSLFYFLSARNPSSKHVYVSPYNWEPLEITTKDVDLHLPDYWVVNRVFMNRLIAEYDKQKMVDYIDGAIKKSYKPVFSLEEWEIWKKVN